MIIGNDRDVLKRFAIGKFPIKHCEDKMIYPTDELDVKLDHRFRV